MTFTASTVFEAAGSGTCARAIETAADKQIEAERAAR